MIKTISALAAIAAAAVLLVPTASLADEETSARVSYADLNLASATGQYALQKRIAVAARTVCGAADHRDLIFSRAVEECRSATIADVQPAYEAAVAGALHPSVTVLGATSLVVTSR
jgi:UrcA family protein